MERPSPARPRQSLHAGAATFMDKFIALSILMALAAMAVEIGFPRSRVARLLLNPPEPHGRCVGLPIPGRLGSLCGFKSPVDMDVAYGTLFVANAGSGQGVRPGIYLHSIDGEPVLLYPPASGKVPEATPEQGECMHPPPPDTFRPTAVSVAFAADGRGTLAVATTGADRTGIELFRLEGGSHMRWVGCIHGQPGMLPLDVALYSNGTVVAVFARGGGGWAGAARRAFASAAAYTVGTWAPSTAAVAVSHLSEGRRGGWTAVPLHGLRWPQSVAIVSGKVVVADATGSVCNVQTGHCVHLEQTFPRRVVAVGGDKVLVVGLKRSVNAAFTALRCVLGRDPCDAPWTLDVANVASERVVRALDRDGRGIGHVSTVVDVNGRWFFGTDYTDRLAVYGYATVESAVHSSDEMV